MSVIAYPFNNFLRICYECIEKLITLTLNEELSINIRYADDTTLIATIFEKLYINS